MTKALKFVSPAVPARLRRASGGIAAAFQSGFTLVEMAVVLVIIGFIVGGGVIAVKPLLQQANLTTTNNNMDQAEAALQLFVINNNRLPCPADGHLAKTSLNYGKEQVTAGISNLTTGTNTPDACAIGSATATNAVIPWLTLNMPEGYSVDGWGNRLAYFPADGALIPGVDSLVDSHNYPDDQSESSTGCLQRMNTNNYFNWEKVSTPPTTRTGDCDYGIGIGDYGWQYNPGYFYANSVVITAPAYPYGNYIAVYAINGSALGTELTTPQPTSLGCPALPGNGGTDATFFAAQLAAPPPAYSCAGGRAAYVLISHGQRGYYGWNRAGNQVLPPSSITYTFKKYNSNASANIASGGNLGFVQGPTVSLTSSANFFDDILRWRSPAYLIQNCGPGKCGNP